MGDEVWPFGEESLHARSLHVKKPDPYAMMPNDLKVSMEIHKDFGPDHDLLAKIMCNESVLIYYGLFSGHECSDNMRNSFGVYCYCLY